MANSVSFIQPIQQLSALKSAETENSAGVSVPFSNILKDAVDNYTELQEVTDADNMALAFGDADNLAQIQIDSLKAETALQTTVQLTSRVVNAYKEIMQMSV